MRSTSTTSGFMGFTVWAMPLLKSRQMIASWPAPRTNSEIMVAWEWESSTMSTFAMGGSLEDIEASYNANSVLLPELYSRGSIQRTNYIVIHFVRALGKYLRRVAHLDMR